MFLTILTEVYDLQSILLSVNNFYTKIISLLKNSQMLWITIQKSG